MNTCAECRFWDRASESELKVCTLLSDDEDAILSSNGHSRKTSMNPLAELRAIDDEGGVLLFTRSDFGCVQFEPKDGVAVEPRRLFYTDHTGDKLTLAESILTGIPIGETRTTKK